MISAEQALTRFKLDQNTSSFNSWQWDSYLKDSVVLLHEGDLHLAHDLVLDWEGPRNMGDFANALARQHHLEWGEGKNLHTFIVDGSLTVDGAVLNADRNGGAILLVTGSLKARSVVGGGSEIRIHGPTTLSEAAFGHYNDGVLGFEGGLSVPIYLNSDHDMWIKGEKRIEFDFFTFRSGMAEDVDSNEEEAQEEEEDENGDPLLPASLLARLDPDIENRATLGEFLREGQPIFRSADGPVDHTPEQWLERVRQRWQRLGQVPEALIDDALVDAALAQSGLAIRHVPASMQTGERIQAALTDAPEAYWLLCDDQRDDPHAVFAIRHGLYIGQFQTEDITAPMCEAAIARDPGHQVGIPPHMASPGIAIQLVMRRQHPNSFPTHWDQEKIRADLPAYLDDADAVPLDMLEKIALRLPGVYQTPEVLAVLHRRLGK